MGLRQKIGDSRVIESRESADGMSIRRRRETLDGKYRFTTYERLERPPLSVKKKDGSKEQFDRDKLLMAISKSVGKFFSSETDIESIVNAVEESVYGLGEPEIQSSKIGDLVMNQLAERNEVAFVRFASVYQKFKSLDEFEEILRQRRMRKEEAA